MTDTILVIGSGTTTRANVEALMDDYFYVNPDTNVVIAVHNNVSDGQIWAAQYALDKEKSVKAYMVPGSKMSGIPTAIPREENNSPIRKACEEARSLHGFVIWNDEDESCLDALAVLPMFGYPALDLTNGLVEIKPTGEVKELVRPTIPALEEVSQEELVLEEKAIEDEFEDDDSDEEEYEDPLYEAINTVAKIFAEAIAVELAKVLRK